MGVCILQETADQPDNPALNQQRGSMSRVQVFHGKNNAKRTRMDRSIVANDIPYLAQGIISEILSYLDVKSLLVCKSVCKRWYAIIKNEFVETHMTRNNGTFHVFKRKAIERAINLYSYVPILDVQVGMLYVLKTLKVRRGKPEIICIDLIQGTDTTCIGPESRSHGRRGLILQLWKEKPTILSLVKDRLSVWVLEDYKKQKWSDEIIISLTFLNEYPRLKKVTPLFLHADGEDMLIYKYLSVCYVYKLESKEFCEAEPSTGKTIEVAETLISLKGV
ncbi:hypothetical protein POM88_035622 [Heracleum sosnowskyi]|uniref:F-box domain-containing protein n=1 Tax=Heracleum sosnowskyi TaxID=360622 RepID=A0AAD8HLP0_9APIA|nr:hypothetical protein POM88_035619 [Heracleum sosnowskyi]KAK1369530.1 hypothetical protein POM88_035622 [Heracleum sosnowskyi]